jgi:hypothetical protein
VLALLSCGFADYCCLILAGFGCPLLTAYQLLLVCLAAGKETLCLPPMQLPVLHPTQRAPLPACCLKLLELRVPLGCCLLQCCLQRVPYAWMPTYQNLQRQRE